MFQPAEEGPGGAKPMIDEGVMDGIDEVYGLHCSPNIKPGNVRIKSGPIMAANTSIKIKISGKGGHSSMPHYFNDVISAGA